MTVRDFLLTRQGLVFLTSSGGTQSEQTLRTVELELAAVGYVLSARLRSRLRQCSLDELSAFHAWVPAALLAHVGGNRKHEPLFRRFPEGVPTDTETLWWRKVLVHFLQAEGQPCLSCRREGTTHVLKPCQHVVCDRCFDGSNYSACPICEHHVDRSSPFFVSAPETPVPKERVSFKLLDLGEDLNSAAKALFVSLCERKQALSPTDRDALIMVVSEYGASVLAWLPPAIPVRENVALVFGTLLKRGNPVEVMSHAKRFMNSATDVLRLIAVFSGTDGSLLRETAYRTVEEVEAPNRFWGRIAEIIGATPPGPRRKVTTVPLRVHRFKVAKLPRALRRALLGQLESMHPDRLVEDMLRHRSYWVWVGEFLHPHEYASRFPNVARAFKVVRGKAPDGTKAPAFETWYAKVDRTVRARDVDAMLSVLMERPGEFVRRLDYVLRVADDAGRDRVLATFKETIHEFATPVLLTLRSHLPTRRERAPVRVYWPKGRIAKGVSALDLRALLPAQTIEAAVSALDAELLRRFAAKPAFKTCVVDEALHTVIVPFNERTAARSAVSLPRGSRVRIPTGKLMRLFLHWCEPEKNGRTTDLDLSVAFYDEAWKYVGVCSYYQLKTEVGGSGAIAKSSGDLRDAPWPDGATEFVDLHRDPAVLAGIRYAVMVINAYAGMPFSLLERAFAGIMLRDDPWGQHFDPRTVELKFALDGDNGVFMPLVLDIRTGELHWLDVHAKGQFEMNDVETSKNAISRICPDLMSYFASGCRMNMFDLALLHGASRCERVFVRGSAVREFVRREGESVEQFHARLRTGEPDVANSCAPEGDGEPSLAMLFRGDVQLPRGSAAYALFRDQVTASLAASDLL